VGRTRRFAIPGSLFPTDAEARALLVGPESVTWRSTSDVRLSAAMLYPLLLQVSHPTVDAGVHDFSDFERRPWDRLLATLDYVNLIVYGGERAVNAGRQLRSLHKGFQGVRADGESYNALEPEVYAWVHATLLETYVAGHAHLGRPMRPDERRSFYREYRGLGRLIGVREGDLPATWLEFRAYFGDIVRHRLERTPSVDRVLRTLSGNPGPPVSMPDPLWRVARLPASRVLYLGSLGLMDPELRRRLGMSWSRLDEASFQALGAASRGLQPVLPRWLQVTGPGHLRWREEAIGAGPLQAETVLPIDDERSLRAW
jgi:uncharacterized protein (DUF2236 family)